MLIKRESRIYSYIDEYGEERLYSFNEYIPEEEYLEEREFARVDYKGLSNKAADALRKKRSAYAKELHKVHRSTQNSMKGRFEPIGGGFTTRDTISAGGVTTRNITRSTRGSDLTPQQFNKFHMNEVTSRRLKGSKDAAQIMRKDVINGYY